MGVVPLTVDCVSKLRLMRYSRFDTLMLRAHVAENGEFCWRIDGSNEYAIGGPWRRRRDIAHLIEITQGPNRDILLSHLLATFKRAGFQIAVVACDDSDLCTASYAKQGFHVLDQIVELERYSSGASSGTSNGTIRPCTRRDFPEVMRVDAQAFPWLWQNSREEFEWYSSLPEVEVYVVDNGQEVVGYAGMTVYGLNGHLDRLAVAPAKQRQGYGFALLSYVIERMEHLQVKRIGLSTQTHNTKSLSLYHKLGFRNTPRTQAICGLWLD